MNWNDHRRSRWEKSGTDLFVKKSKRPGQVGNDEGSLVLGEVNATLDVSQQRSAADLLENKVEPVVLLKILNQLDDVRVSLAVVEYLNLLEHPGPAVPSHLLDDLGRGKHKTKGT